MKRFLFSLISPSSSTPFFFFILLPQACPSNFSSLFTKSPLLRSQGSTSHWSAFDSDPCDTNSILSSRVPFDDLCNRVSWKSKRSRTAKQTEVTKNCGLSIPATSTLMEAQEFGEKIEHVDEVNFALDGLRKGQPVRVFEIPGPQASSPGNK